MSYLLRSVNRCTLNNLKDKHLEMHVIKATENRIFRVFFSEFQSCGLNEIDKFHQNSVRKFPMFRLYLAYFVNIYTSSALAVNEH